MRLSASRISMWMTCPLQAEFKYKMGLPTRQNAKATFGSIIHKCLERYHLGDDIDECIELFRTLWAEPERINLAPDYWPKYTSYTSLKQKGLEILKEYDEKARWEHKKILAVEHPFLVPFGDHELQGVVDFVEVKKGSKGTTTLRVVDLKTAGAAPSRPSLRLNQQFTVYMYAIEQPEFFTGNGPGFPPLENGEQLFKDFEKVERKAIWYHLMTNKEIDAGPRDDGDYMRLYRVATEIAKASELGVHVPKIGDSCVLCDFNEPCGIEIPTVEELDQE